MSSKVQNIITEHKTNSTIDRGIELLDKSGDMATAVRAKSVGLQLTVLGLAEIQALRIQNLAVAAYNIEQRLYSPEIIEKMDPRKLIGAYEALNTAIRESLEYIKGAQSMDYKQLETDLITLAALESDQMGDSPADIEAANKKREVSNLAQELLAELGQSESNGTSH